MKNILSRVSSNNCFIYVKTLPVMCQEPVPSWQFWVALIYNKYRLVTSIALFKLMCNPRLSSVALSPAIKRRQAARPDSSKSGHL